MNQTHRKVAVFTGNRAEYGLQFPILRAIERHPYLHYSLLVSGAHLDPHFGSTLDEIKKDGFSVDAEVAIEMDAGSLYATAQAIGSGISAVSRVLSKIKPDIMVVYADRFEGFAAVVASTQMNIPTAHVEGGDLTEGGALDDSVRHAMTKLSHLHFTTNQQASNRILAMGEEPWRVHTVGFPAIDLISERNFASPKEIVEELGVDLSRPLVLFTQHSVATQFDRAASQLQPALRSIESLVKKDVQVILTYPNNDAGGALIIDALRDFDAKGLPGVTITRSLGRYLYHGILALAEDDRMRVACVGNSSSGLKETPAFGCPTVNIGSRQDGRLRGENVIDAGYDATDIESAIIKCLFDQKFRQKCREAENPYGIGDAGPKIANVLAEVDLNEKLILKRMTLRGIERDGWFR